VFDWRAYYADMSVEDLVTERDIMQMHVDCANTLNDSLYYRQRVDQLNAIIQRRTSELVARIQANKGR
jgi:hypothetical protein